MLQSLEKFHEYIHRIGGQVMQTQYVEPVKNTNNNVEENKDAIDIKLRNKRAGKILRRKIKVEDVEDGLVEILMDKVFIDVLDRNPEKGPDIFLQLTSKLSGNEMANFMSGNFKLIIWLKIIFKLPKIIFLKSLYRIVKYG